MHIEEVKSTMMIKCCVVLLPMCGEWRLVSCILCCAVMYTYNLSVY